MPQRTSLGTDAEGEEDLKVLGSAGKVGYPPIKDVVKEVESGWLAGIAPSGNARRALEMGREEDDDPAGDDGDIAKCVFEVWINLMTDD